MENKRDTREPKKQAEEEEPGVEAEKSYSTREVVDKLRRLADALEAGKTFEIKIAGNRIYVPANATIEFEYEQTEDTEEIEIELQWKRHS
jgi:amphi-Trp domain-containing protein